MVRKNLIWIRFKHDFLFLFEKKDKDDVAVCQLNSDGTVSLKHYYNKGYSSALLLNSNPTIGYSNIETSYANGIASCSFTRELKMPSVANYFDLSYSYYILTANGPLRSGF